MRFVILSYTRLLLGEKRRIGKSGKGREGQRDQKRDRINDSSPGLSVEGQATDFDGSEKFIDFGNRAAGSATARGRISIAHMHTLRTNRQKCRALAQDTSGSQEANDEFRHCARTCRLS